MSDRKFGFVMLAVGAVLWGIAATGGIGGMVVGLMFFVPAIPFLIKP